MTLQLSVRARNASLDAIETVIGATATLEIRSGAAPASCAAADSGTVLVTIVLPSDWASAAANGAKALLGAWSDLAADAAGTAGHFRLKGAGVCDMQGTVTGTGLGGDMTLDNTNIAVNQQVSITSFTLTAGGA